MANISVLLGIVLGLLSAAFFSGTEMAFVSLKKILLRKKSTHSEHDLRRIQEIMRHPARFISLVLIGTNISLVAASSLSTMLVTHLLPESSEVFIELLVLAVLTPIIVLFCEVLPKNIGVLYARAICYKVNRPILLLMKLFLPLIQLFGALSNGVLRVLGHHSHHKKVFVTRKELRAIVEEGMLKGGRGEKEKELIDTIFEFEHKLVKDKMRPIDKVKKVDVNATVAELKELATEATRVRFVVESKKDRSILGFIHIFDVLFEAEGCAMIKDFIRTPIFASESITLHQAFTILLERKEWILFAVDSDDKVSGILTLKDILNF